MKLTAIDWSIIGGYFLLSLSVGLYFTRRAGKSTDEYFLAGRSIPWWLAGVSIVATTFSSDTPLLVTGITARGGIAGNWVWWAFVLSGMLTVFFFARLWRRAGVMTDVEFTTIRYSGRAADFLAARFDAEPKVNGGFTFRDGPQWVWLHEAADIDARRLGDLLEPLGPVEFAWEQGTR